MDTINNQRDKQNRNLFYWNCSDNKQHTYKRIEWVRYNKYMVCVNINKLLYKKISIEDIILTYEPKQHKISKFKHGKYGYCMVCKKHSNDLSYHFRIHPNTTYIFFGDLDNYTNTLDHFRTILDLFLLGNYLLVL
jgi:hypothetical protein